MEKKNRNLWLLLISALAFWYLVALFVLNMFIMPRGFHLSVYVERVPEMPYHLKYLMFRPLSKFIFRHTGNYCDLPEFAIAYESAAKDQLHHVLKNFTISALIAAHTDPEINSDEARNFIYAELERAVTKCDINITDTETVIGGGRKEIPPIFAAIFLRDEKVVSLLLKHNVDLNNKLNNPGKPSDQMTPLEFARNFEKNTKDERIKRDLRHIIALIESHIQSDSSVPPKPAISEIVSP